MEIFTSESFGTDPNFLFQPISNFPPNFLFQPISNFPLSFQNNSCIGNDIIFFYTCLCWHIFWSSQYAILIFYLVYMCIYSYRFLLLYIRFLLPASGDFAPRYILIKDFEIKSLIFLDNSYIGLSPESSRCAMSLALFIISIWKYGPSFPYFKIPLFNPVEPW